MLLRNRPSLGRRPLLGGALAAALPRLAAAQIGATLNAGEWASFRSRFVAPDGRVVDNANGGVSHSEGQGWGMLFAAAANDQASFETIQSWTARTLRRPNDALHSWRYDPNGRPPIADVNNATDGDLFIMSALARAGRRWGKATYLQAAAAIARDIQRLLVRQVADRLLLLPGVDGFDTDKALILNPSYYALPMLADASRLVPSGPWQQIVQDGIAVIGRGRFGHWQLPPDWLRVSRPWLELTVAPGWPPRFSFDAVRVPLWGTWARRPTGNVRRSIARFWSTYPSDAAPAWIDLVNNETAPYPLTPGMVAVARLTLAAVDGHTPNLPSVAGANKYYDASLILLCQMAWQESQA